jgi:hypothetical protein
MTPKHLNLNRTGRRRLTGIVLALLPAILGGTAYLLAQPGDTPIVIGDGSLTMQSAVPWSRFSGTGHAHGHPDATKAVTSVDITMPALSHTVSFSGEKAEVDVTYAGTFNITVATGSNGKKLMVNTDFGSFHQGADANHLVQNNGTGVITHVTVLRNGAVAFDSAASGHTNIVIHYQ